MSNLNLNLIKAFLAVVVLFLGYKLYRSIQDEIDLTAKIETNEEQVKISLDRIRLAQTAYRDVNSHFANKKDTLINFLKYGKMQVTKEFGDPDDSTSQYIKQIRIVPVSSEILVGYNYDSLFIVPHQQDTFFTMAALIITQNKVEVPVFEVFDPVPFNPDRQKDGTKPPLTVGSLVEATYSGNWK
jgi:hypothetical protein